MYLKRKGGILAPKVPKILGVFCAFSSENVRDSGAEGADVSNHAFSHNFLALDIQTQLSLVINQAFSREFPALGKQIQPLVVIYLYLVRGM